MKYSLGTLPPFPKDMDPKWREYFIRLHRELTGREIASFAYNDWETVQGTVDTNAYGSYAVLYLASDGNYDTALADSTSTMPACVIAPISGTGVMDLVRKGTIQYSGWSWSTVGSAGRIYVSPTTAGALTQTRPSTTGHQIQDLGYATASDTIYFYPDPNMVEYV